MSYDDYADEKEFRMDDSSEFGDPALNGEEMEGMHVVGEEEESDDPEDRYS